MTLFKNKSLKVTLQRTGKNCDSCDSDSRISTTLVNITFEGTKHSGSVISGSIFAFSECVRMCGILAVFGIRAGGGSERYRGDVIRLSKQGPDSIETRGK